MPFSQEAGYTPASFQTIMNSLMTGINTQFGTAYTPETFIGSNWYKFSYAMAQRIQAGEIKTSEAFLKLQQYIALTNQRISRPVVTNPGLIEKFLAEGYIASVKPPADADAGKVNVCVDVNDGDHATGLVTITNFANLVSGTADKITVGATQFTAQAAAATPGAATFQAATSLSATATSLATQINAHATAGALVNARAVGAEVYLTALHGGTAGNSIALAYTNGDANVGATVSGATLADGTTNADYAADKLEICTIIKNSVVAGCPTYGSESETIVISNGQSFDFKFHLPVRIPIKLRLTIALSENNQVVVGDPDETKQKLLDNIRARYSLGRNFEPQRYFSVIDAPWAAYVTLEWAEKGSSLTYSTAVYDSPFNHLFDINLEDIELVEV